jgi:prevent-host-death family protein
VRAETFALGPSIGLGEVVYRFPVFEAHRPNRYVASLNGGDDMREMTICEADQNFSRLIAAAERGETIIITKDGTPVARITPHAVDRTNDPEWRSAFAALEKSLRSKPATGYRVGTIAEGDEYGAGA